MLGNNKHHYLESFTFSLLPRKCCPVHRESSKYPADAGGTETRVTGEDADSRCQTVVVSTGTCINPPPFVVFDTATVGKSPHVSGCGRLLGLEPFFGRG